MLALIIEGFHFSTENLSDKDSNNPESSIIIIFLPSPLQP